MAVASLDGPISVGEAWGSGECVGEEILALSVADRKRAAGGGIIRCGVPDAMYRLAALCRKKLLARV